MQVTVHEAKTQLSKLIRAVEAGEDVVIARGNKPVIRLVVVEEPAPRTFAERLSGPLAHLSGDMPDFLEPMSEEELAAWEGDPEP